MSTVLNEAKQCKPIPPHMPSFFISPSVFFPEPLWFSPLSVSSCVSSSDEGVVERCFSKSRISNEECAITIAEKPKKKQQKAIKGIEIEYSLTPDFQNPVFKSTGKKKANVKVKKLAPKKTYYVRAHTYVIRDGVKYVSNWSGTRKVKVK